MSRGINQHTDIERGLDVVKPSLRGGNSATYLVARLKRDAPVLAPHGEIGNGRSRGSDTTSTSIGRGTKYLASRLKRDAPEIAARISDFLSMRGSLLTVRGGDLSILKVPINDTGAMPIRRSGKRRITVG